MSVASPGARALSIAAAVAGLLAGLGAGCDCGGPEPTAGGESGDGGSAGAGVLVPPGGSCAAPGECSTGFCAASVCCTTACDGLCQLCSATGLCAAAPPFSDPDERCGACRSCSPSGICDPVQRGGNDVGCEEENGQICDGEGACKQRYGQACSASSDCFGCPDGSCSGACAGGLCASGVALGATAYGGTFALDRAGAAYTPARNERGESVLLAFGYTGVARSYPLRGAEARGPAIGAGDAVYVVDGAELVELSPSRVEEKHRFVPGSLDPAAIGTAPAVGRDGRSVYFGVEGNLYRVEAGQELARYSGPVPGGRIGTPSVARSSTVFATEGTLLRSFAGDTLAAGASVELPVGLEDAASPTLAGDDLFLAGSGGVAAFSIAALATGPRWTYAPGDVIVRPIPVVLEASGATLLVTTESSIDRIAVADGSRVARIELDSPTAPCALEDGSVLVGDASHPVIRVGRNASSLDVGIAAVAAPLPAPQLDGALGLDANGFLWAVPVSVFQVRGAWSTPRAGPTQDGLEKGF